MESDSVDDARIESILRISGIDDEKTNPHSESTGYFSIQDANIAEFPTVEQRISLLNSRVSENIHHVQLQQGMIKNNIETSVQQVENIFESYSLSLQKRKTILLKDIENIANIKKMSLDCQLTTLKNISSKLKHFRNEFVNVDDLYLWYELNSGVWESPVDVSLKCDSDVYLKISEIGKICSNIFPFRCCIDEMIGTSGLIFSVAGCNKSITINVMDHLWNEEFMYCQNDNIRLFTAPFSNDKNWSPESFEACLKYQEIKIKKIKKNDVLIQTNGKTKLSQKVVVKFNVHFPGIYKFAVFINGRHIKYSPFNLKVMEKVNYNSLKFKQPTVFGGPGNKNGNLCRPWGVFCIKTTGNIVVADRSNNRIQMFSADGKFILSFGKAGSSPGEFNKPAGITACHLNEFEMIVVADKDNHRIQLFDMRGNFHNMFGRQGYEPGNFNYPWDVACNNLGYLVVSDTRNRRIQMFNIYNGTFISLFSMNSENWNPRGVSFDNDQYLFVSDFDNHRIVKLKLHHNYTSDKKIETRIRKLSTLSTYCAENSINKENLLVVSVKNVFGSEGSNIGQLKRPQGIAVTEDGKIIVAESRNGRVQIFSKGGLPITQIYVNGPNSAVVGEPQGVCVNNKGNVVFVDQQSCTVKII